METTEIPRGELLLQPGFHGTLPEVSFVNSVVGKYVRGLGYKGPVQLVGSRGLAKPSWVSLTQYGIYCGGLEKEVQQQWLDFLNDQARQLGLNRREIQTLVRTLPESAPREISLFLREAKLIAGSDFDLLIDKRPHGTKLLYPDHKTGQTVEFWTPDDVV